MLARSGALVMRVRPRLLALPLAGGLLASCASGPVSPDAYELANMRPSNVVPKSSPASLVATFKTHCVDRLEAPETIPAGLRAADYVELPDRRGDGLTTFVVDDRRPMVMVNTGPGAALCAVAAESRTGQTTRVQSFVADEFPGATPVDPARIGRDVESAWLVGTDTPRIVFTTRLGAPTTPASLILAIGET